MKIVNLISFVALIFVISSVWGQSEYLEDDIMSEIFENDEDFESSKDFEEIDRLEVEQALKAAAAIENAQKENEHNERMQKEKKRSSSKNKLHNHSSGTAKASNANANNVPNMADILGRNKQSTNVGGHESKTVKSGGRATMNSAGHGVSGIEQALSEQLRARYEQAQEERAQQIRATSLRKVRFSMPRSIAEPIERILALYNGPQNAEDWLPVWCLFRFTLLPYLSYLQDMYSILGVNSKANEVTLKKAYRALALVIHPDKNPHPDAQKAFDAIQDAYSTLSIPQSRSQYNQDLSRDRKGRRLTFRRVRKLFHERWVNLLSGWQLLNLEIQQAGLQGWIILKKDELRKSISSWIAGIRSSGGEWVEHMLYLPSAGDRLRLFHEQFVRHLPTTVTLCILQSLATI